MTLRPAILFVLMTCLLAATAAVAEDFPLRPYYPEIRHISTEDLLDQYDEAIILDIRSSLEYDVAKINKAFLLPITDDDFSKRLSSLRTKDSPRPLVFYCNGHSCAKSYQGAQIASSLGYTNVFAYDGGIFDWINAAPDKATLMGTTPARKNRIISTTEYERRLISYDQMMKMTEDPTTVVIDIRDPFQRESMPRIPGIKNIPLDPLLDLVTSRIWTEKQLVFFDAVGKQVRWLQYFLEAYGYFDYAFLRDGVRGIADDPAKVKPVIETNRSIITNQEMLLQVTRDPLLDNTDRKVLNYLLANVKFNNYIVVNQGAAVKAVGMAKHIFMESVNKLHKAKYINSRTMQDTLIVQVNPRLAWKGVAGDSLWKSKVREFDNLISE